MEMMAALLLAAVGFVGGVVTAIVGGSSLICFPALLAAGLPPIVASASNTVAVTPASLIAAFADTGRKPAWSARLVAFAAIAFVGSALGAALLLVLPESIFVQLIPVLIGMATLLFALGNRLRDRLRRRLASDRHDPSAILQAVLFAPVSVYGGYFGAGMGIMALAILALGGSGDHRTTNATKNLLCALTNVVAIGIYVLYDIVAWPATVAMMAGAILGGFAGGRLMRLLPAQPFRIGVVGLGAVLTIFYAQRYWGG